MNSYGESKLAGEVAAGVGATVVRSTWLQPGDLPGMVGRVFDSLEAGEPIRLIADRWACPTFVADLAPVLLRLGAERVAGVVHATNAGVTSWHGFAQKIFELAGVEKADLSPISSESYPTPAPRPAYSVLNCDRLNQVFQIRLPDWREALSRCIACL